MVSRIEKAARTGRIDAVLREIPFDDFATSLRNVSASNALDVMKEAAMVSPLPVGIKHSFTLTNPEVFNYLREEALNEALKLSTDAERAVQAAVTKAFTQGGHPHEIAKEIKQFVGLTENEWESVNRFRQGMTDLLSGASPTAKRMEMLGRVGAKTTFHTSGMSAGRVEELVNRYIERMMKFRAETVARTVTIDASNEAQGQLWKQAVQSGAINPSRWKVKWIVSRDDRTCPRCMGMYGKTRPIEGAYDNGVKRPTLHPRCRCCEGLVSADSVDKTTGRAPTKPISSNPAVAATRPFV